MSRRFDDLDAVLELAPRTTFGNWFSRFRRRHLFAAADAIFGPLPGIPNVLVATGFSGHGLQQAPAVGRGLAEPSSKGRFTTLDLAPLGYERIAEGRPLREENVV